MKPIISFAISVTLLTLAIIGYAGFRNVVADKSIAVASLSKQIQQRSDATSRIAAARSALGELAGNEKAVKNYFVPQAGVVSFINDLQDRGSALGTTVDIASVAAASDPLRPALKLTISVRGTFDAVMRTLGSIEYAPYDLSIKKLSLSLDTKSMWVASADLSVGSPPASPDASRGGPASATVASTTSS
ncbi:MAG: hypothetical protein Q7S95_04010 [bacterium]|nr:hypothetical protein [bacterium]